MTEQKKNYIFLGVLLTLCILCYGKILFTDKIIRAPDIINEYYWAVIRLSHQSLTDIFSLKLTADWDIYNNSGNTLEGGGLGNHFLFWQGLLYYFIKPPASVGWFIVLHFFVGGAGTFMLCRAIGASLLASLLGGLIFALAPEMASLINAGHVLKIATICVAPWAFYLFERGFQTRRAVWFMATAFVLALQFFYTHWQIAYYTCLCVGAFGICRLIGIAVTEGKKGQSLRLVGLNLVVLCFFLSTVAIDLLPLANWSKETNRGAMSGANQGKGGLDRDEAMMWSLPPEELAGFLIPGLFGFSRQEGGENPTNIGVYYWGRMAFTQTVSYFGMLPWLLLPLPLIFRRDRHTVLALGAIIGGLLFSMGKYTPFYNLLFDFFPGIDRFRVPKMMLFVPLIGGAALAARGLDLLRDEEIRTSPAFRRYLHGITALVIALLVLLGVEYFGKDFFMRSFVEFLGQPTRYEQGPQLITQRWINVIVETAIAALFAAGYAAVIAGTRSRRAGQWAGYLLILLFVLDVGRVNAKYMFLVDAPKETKKNYTTPVVDFLKGQPKEYRVLPVSGGPGPYSSNNVPVMFIPMPVQQQRWQNFLDSFSLMSALPDIINVRYVIYSAAQYAQERAQLGDKYAPLFQSPDGNEVVLENRAVMPKAWLVPSVLTVSQPQQVLAVMQSQQFEPRRFAVVESPPALQMAEIGAAATAATGNVKVTRYEGEKIDLSVANTANAMLVLGEKYYKGWKADVDGKAVDIQRANYILRGVYLAPGTHRVEFRFDPLPFKIGKYLTLVSFVLFAAMLVREWWIRRRVKGEG
ncbi:MAG TPA: YfhO family protein [Desulfuromonadales bacterium]|nr:YfhO family protein [Desulfuromonadales bacterium]